jgi:hypothetical protein
MKNLVQLQNYAYPRDLEREIARFVDYYNHQRYHESLDNVTPADVHFGRAKEVQTRRQEIKRRTLEGRSPSSPICSHASRVSFSERLCENPESPMAFPLRPHFLLPSMPFLGWRPTGPSSPTVWRVVGLCSVCRTSAASIEPWEWDE